MSGWFLDSLEIEGFRGINNENDPLVLKFSKDAVNSISAPNGVGKSSIFDAISFALRREIPKLDKLAATEGGAEYYVNRFHSKTSGTIKLTLVPDTGTGPSIPIIVTRDAIGVRKVTAPAGVNGEQLLASLDRDFVLLDHRTLQSFIDDKAIDRGRAFAGLLGLARYSDLRQKLQALSNTVAFNKHFDTKNRAARQTSLKTTLNTLHNETTTAFKLLSKSELAECETRADAETAAHAALHQIGILTAHCFGKTFSEIDVDACIETVSQEEGAKTNSSMPSWCKRRPSWWQCSERDPTMKVTLP